MEFNGALHQGCLEGLLEKEDFYRAVLMCISTQQKSNSVTIMKVNPGIPVVNHYHFWVFFAMDDRGDLVSKILILTISVVFSLQIKYLS